MDLIWTEGRVQIVKWGEEGLSLRCLVRSSKFCSGESFSVETNL